ncbi:TPA: hypothetical protein QEK98_002947 [Stenotrophomonas maltophilia]|nr:hypothetical protein [Stenotrophomonas maltophilia]
MNVEENESLAIALRNMVSELEDFCPTPGIIDISLLKRVIAEMSRREGVPDEVWITFDSEGKYEEIEYNFFDVTDAGERMMKRAERLGLKVAKFVRAE